MIKTQLSLSRLKPFIVAPAVAAADLGEAQVDVILAHRGSVRKQAGLAGVPGAVVRWRRHLGALGTRQ
jgi:hypothetical protein